jgi:formylmethanofuran dehydrogenase subunit E
MESAKSIWNNPSEPATARTKAYNSYLRAKKQKENLLKDLRSHEVKKAEAERPVHLIKIEPRSALRKCPKCGEEFYDINKNEKGSKNISSKD